MNIFENTTKEMFIEIYNEANYRNKLYKIGSELDFNYVIAKKIPVRNYSDKIIISDILNYEEEIEVFISFDVIKEYNGKEIIICDNFNKYFQHRNKTKRINIYDYYNPLDLRKSINAFNTYVRKENKKQISNDIKEQILNEQINPFKVKFTEILQPKFNLINFTCRINIKYKISFEDFDKLSNEYKLTNKILIENKSINKFNINIEYDLNTDKLKEFVSNLNELYDSVIETADYLKYVVYLKENYGQWFIVEFNKIE